MQTSTPSGSHAQETRQLSSIAGGTQLTPLTEEWYTNVDHILSWPDPDIVKIGAMGLPKSNYDGNPLCNIR